MEWYRVNLASESWVASAWQSDTIWGHLCWCLRYGFGEDALQNFIDAYEQGAPPLLVSNGFPGDYLPRPIVPEMKAETGQSLDTLREEFRRNKELKGVNLLTADEFTKAIKGERFYPVPKDDIEARTVVLKNQINRLTSTTGVEGTGQLFSFEQYRWESISIYLKVADGFVDKTRELFQHLAQSGYGKRKAVGYGQVRLVEFGRYSGFPSVVDANGFISLSNFTPSTQDPSTGYWDVLVKYGKLGEEYAAAGNPFKKPLIMFTAGSCFYDIPCKEYYGRLVRGLSPIHTDKIVQYGLALPVPMVLPQPQTADENV